MDNFIVIAIILAVLGLVIWYLVRAKKRGQKCVGCPHSCPSKNGGCCGCEVKSDK